MKKYTAKIQVWVLHDTEVEIEAENEREALEKAWELQQDGELDFDVCPDYMEKDYWVGIYDDDGFNPLIEDRQE